MVPDRVPRLGPILHVTLEAWMGKAVRGVFGSSKREIDGEVNVIVGMGWGIIK